ncbi:NACHT domain-containing protein [Glycomyces sp. NPDC047010]|uniref:NACHT domain-containing protein n=1 Tax=Glycomyces sp. NPDC047010 TaxID=3155023 RepID=UPI0034118585
MSVAGRAITSILGLSGLPLTWLVIDQNLAKPWLAVLLLVLYEAVIGLGAMMLSVAQQTVRTRLEQLANFTDLALGRRVSRYARHYRRYVIEQNAHINARDLAHTPSHIPELDAVYVDVGLVPDSPSKRPGGLLPIGRDDGRTRRPIHEFLDRSEPAVLAVIGAPGGGKTTLLRHTASRAAAANKRDQRRRVPVVLALRDHSEELAEDPDLSLADVIRASVGRLDVLEPAGWWETQLREGNCLILFDGLDEVARNEDRLAVSEWIAMQNAKHPGNDFVVTSRPHGYQTAVIPKAVVLQVRPFTSRQITKFVHAWCVATEQFATGKSGSEIEYRAREDAEDILVQLNSAPVLYELAVNPLLLTMMVTVHRERRALPTGRAELYNQVCDVMLWRRMESKKLEVRPGGPVRQRILSQLAYNMMREETRDFPRSEVISVFGRMLQSGDTEISAEDLLESIVNSSGLLIERERDLFSFSHHTFCEYLASVHIRANGLGAQLEEVVGNPWWRETTLLYVADNDATGIVSAAVARDTGDSLSLAFDCLNHHAQIDRGLRDVIERIQEGAFRVGASREDRLRVARALFSSHTNKVIQLEGGSWICANPIPDDLYWLFTKDWNSVLPPDGFRGLDHLSPAPAAGMWAREALEFLDWANSLAVSENRTMFRFPTPEELFTMRSASHWQRAWVAPEADSHDLVPYSFTEGLVRGAFGWTLVPNFEADRDDGFLSESMAEIAINYLVERKRAGMMVDVPLDPSWIVLHLGQARQASYSATFPQSFIESVERLLEKAVGSAERRTVPQPEDFAHIRLSAVDLASEADEQGDMTTADELLKVAFYITWYQARLKGSEPLEVIYLVRE